MPVGFSHIIPQNSHGYLKSVGLFFCHLNWNFNVKNKRIFVDFPSSALETKGRMGTGFFYGQEVKKGVGTEGK